jgi:hypothetical protein
MKFILVFTFLSVYGVNFSHVTETSFDNFDDCEVHEMYLDTPDINLALMCIKEDDVQNFIEEADSLF